MTIATKRKKLHEFIDTVDDSKVNSIFSIVEWEVNRSPGLFNSSSKADKIKQMKLALGDPLFLEDLKEINKDFEAVDNENI